MMPDKTFLLDQFGYSSLTELFEGLYVAAILESYGRLRHQADLCMLNENGIRNRLAKDLEFKNALLKPFLDDNILFLNYEGIVVNSRNDETRRTDISFSISWIGKFVVECKKLGGFTSNYVTEGVHRFRDKAYSEKDSEAGMLAFVVGRNLLRIVSKTKSTVEADLSFVPSVVPQATCATHPHSFHSTHQRVSLDPIFIHHIFLDFTLKQTK